MSPCRFRDNETGAATPSATTKTVAWLPVRLILKYFHWASASPAAGASCLVLAGGGSGGRSSISVVKLNAEKSSCADTAGSDWTGIVLGLTCESLSGLTSTAAASLSPAAGTRFSSWGILRSAGCSEESVSAITG